MNTNAAMASSVNINFANGVNLEDMIDKFWWWSEKKRVRVYESHLPQLFILYFQLQDLLPNSDRVVADMDWRATRDIQLLVTVVGIKPI